MAVRVARYLILAAPIAAGILAVGAAPPPGSAARTSAPPFPPPRLTAHRMGPRPGAVRRGTSVKHAELFTMRVFANGSDGFALADLGNAQYPACSLNGGRTWLTCGPQVHVDAADGAEGVGYVGVSGPRRFYAYGSSVVDVTTNSGRTWWETYLGELVVGVVPGPRDDLVAYVQQVGSEGEAPAVTWQYVSHDGGRHWTHTRALGGG